MFIVAESGSTKVEWRLMDGEELIHHFYTTGLNPYIQKEDEINSIIQMEVVPGLDNYQPEKAYFYGAACSSISNQNKMKNAYNRCK